MRDWPRGPYALTFGTDDTALLLHKTEAALAGGVVAVQYRDKSGDVARRHEQASELLELCRDHRVPLLVNDDPWLADIVGADGVHLGRDDCTPDKARVILGPHKLIGVSCYQSLERARAAVAGGADYVAFGAFFPSSTKPDAARAGLELITGARELGKPVVAIGGITLENAAPLVAAGAHNLAVITALFDAPDVRVAASGFAALYATRH